MSITGTERLEQIKLLRKNSPLEYLRICRVCLQQGSIKIRTPNPTVQLYCGINIKADDGYPQYMCRTCFSTLNAAIQLRKTAQKTHELLYILDIEEHTDEEKQKDSYIESTSNTVNLELVKVEFDETDNNAEIVICETDISYLKTEQDIKNEDLESLEISITHDAVDSTDAQCEGTHLEKIIVTEVYKKLTMPNGLTVYGCVECRKVVKENERIGHIREHIKNDTEVVREKEHFTHTREQIKKNEKVERENKHFTHTREQIKKNEKVERENKHFSHTREQIKKNEKVERENKHFSHTHEQKIMYKKVVRDKEHLCHSHKKNMYKNIHQDHTYAISDNTFKHKVIQTHLIHNDDQVMQVKSDQVMKVKLDQVMPVKSDQVMQVKSERGANSLCLPPINKGASKFKCQFYLCQKVFNRFSSLKHHVCRTHNVILQIKCPQCPFKGPTRKVILKHLKVHRQCKDSELQLRKRKVFKCPLCPKIYQHNYTLTKHTRKHADPSYDHTQPRGPKVPKPKFYICEICGLTFKRITTLRYHHTSHFSIKFQFKCEKCPYKGRTKEYLRIHSKVHSDELPHKCHICSRAFRHLCNLRHHLRRHGDPTFSCSQCDKKFYENSSLNYHFKIYHLNDRFRSTCHICGITYLHRKQLLVHEIKKHNRKKTESNRRALCYKLGKQDTADCEV